MEELPDKNFFVVLFDNREWAVVPKVWLFVKKSQLFCKWPSSGAPNKLAKLKKLPAATWDCWVVKEIHNSSGE